MITNNDARYVYLRDDETNTAWNIGQGPLDTPVEDYRCEHSIGFSQVSSTCSGIRASWRIHVPQDSYYEVWTIRLRNQSEHTRKLSMFSAVTFELDGFSYPRYYEMYRCVQTTYDAQLNGVYAASAHPFAPHKRYNAFLASDTPVHAWDGDLAAFCGAHGSITKLDASAYALFQRPEVVMYGGDCTCSAAALFILGGVLQHKLVLQPGEEKQIMLSLGVSESIVEARNVIARYHDAAVLANEFTATVNYNLCKYADLFVKTPDQKINNVMNWWLKKQIDCCIVGKKGVRDNLQIAVALLNYRQTKAQAEILECLRHQFKDGHAVLTWYPYDDTRYSDQPFWIVWAVCELIKETGNLSILEQQIEWQDGGSATVLEHLKAALFCLLENRGPHGLMKLFFADWNDALNVTTDPEAESVMLSHQTCLALSEMEALMHYAGLEHDAEELGKARKALVQQINAIAWDGEWYMRALSKKENIGSKNSDGSKIYLNAQTWAVLSDVVPAERMDVLLHAIDGMEHDFGFPLNLPPYEHYSPHTGRMSGMLPGLFENGGVYCHATGFKILMDCKLKRGKEALRTLKKIMPDSEKNPSTQSGAEPYVFTNCYATHPLYYGRSYWSWTTGTSAWSMMALYEGILGVKRDYVGLSLNPCFTPEWERAEMTRHFRGADYHIVVLNPHHLETGHVAVTMDGQAIAGSHLPIMNDGKKHEVVAIIEQA